MPERWGRYGRWGGSSLRCLESGPHARRAGGFCASLGRLSRAKVWGTLTLALGAGGAPSGSRHLLPYFHVDLWPGHRRLPRSPESPDSPVSNTPRSAAAPLPRQGSPKAPAARSFLPVAR